jgi:hypothetical protein
MDLVEESEAKDSLIDAWVADAGVGVGHVAVDVVEPHAILMRVVEAKARAEREEIVEVCRLVHWKIARGGNGSKID